MGLMQKPIYILIKNGLALTLSYTYGKDDGSGLPMDHIPPLYGKSQLNWTKTNTN